MIVCTIAGFLCRLPDFHIHTNRYLSTALAEYFDSPNILVALLFWVSMPNIIILLLLAFNMHVSSELININ